MHTLEDPTRGETAADISRAVVRVLHDHTGRGPTRARTELGANLVTVVLADTLTKGEQNLVAYGKGQMVLDVRHEFQAAMRTDLVAAVEEITNGWWVHEAGPQPPVREVREGDDADGGDAHHPGHDRSCRAEQRRDQHRNDHRAFVRPVPASMKGHVAHAP